MIAKSQLRVMAKMHGEATVVAIAHDIVSDATDEVELNDKN